MHEFEIKENKVDENNTESLQVKPGFVFSFSETPEITLLNTGTTELEITIGDEEYSLAENEGTSFNYEPEEEFSFLEIESYKTFRIPIVYFGEIIDAPNSLDLRPEQEVLGITFNSGTKGEEEFTFFNFAEEELQIIDVDSSLGFLTFEDLEDFEAKEIQNLTVNYDLDIPNHYTGTIDILYNQSGTLHNLSVPISIFVLPKGVEVENFTFEEESCSVLGGIICAQGEGCEGESKFTKGAEFCCLGICNAVELPDGEEGGSSGLIIGIIIFLALAGAGYWLYRRSKKVPKEDADKKLADTNKELEEKMKTATPQKVSGQLDSH